MNTQRPATPRATDWRRAALLALLLAGCGGVDSGGTGATTYASGPISGFGSVIVNGVRFDDSSPNLTVSDDDGSRSKNELKLGMVVEIRGSAVSTDASGNSSSNATSISFSSELVGPVDSTSLGTQSMVVIGQTVDIKTTTVFDDSLGGGLIALAPGDIVEVYALYDASTGHYTATRVERKSVPLPLEYRIRGAISALDLTTKTFNIGSQRISYQFQAAPAGLADGAIVRIRVNTLKSGGVWEATRLREGSNRPDDNTHTRVEGLVNAFTSTAQFSVNGIAVATNSGTSFTPNPPVFNAGVRVEVEGTMAGNTLVASKVEIEDSGGNTEFDLRGPIEALTTTTLTVRGQTVTYGPGVIYEPQGKLATDLGVGLVVEVRATLFNGTQLQASRIKFK